MKQADNDSLLNILIDYWHRKGVQDPLVRNRCRQLSQRVLAQLPVSIAALVPAIPEQHKEAISSAIATLRASDPVARGLMDQLLPPPPAAARPASLRRSEPISLTLRLAATAAGTIVQSSSDAAGQGADSVQLPYSGDDLSLVLRALDWLQHPHGELDAFALKRLHDLGLASPGGYIDPQAYRQVGRQLYWALGRSKHVADAINSLLNTAIYQDAWLDIRLHIPEDGVALAALPWELLWGDGDQPLAFKVPNYVTITRHIDIAAAMPPSPQASGPLRLLCVVARAGISEEQRATDRLIRQTVFDPLIRAGQLIMEEVPATRRALVDRMQQGVSPDILHIVCHGRYFEGEGYLILDSPDGGWDRVPASRLGSLLQKLRLVTLIACQSSMFGSSSLLTGVAPALSAAGATAVVGMQFTIRAAAVQRFCEVMYRSMIAGEPLQLAVGKARQALYFEEVDGVSWFVPTLTIRTRTPGPLFLY